MDVDKIIITNLPAFYKVNLFNEIAKVKKIYVVFTGNTEEIRNNDFFKKDLICFDFVDLKNKSTLSRFIFLMKLLLLTKYRELILGGWDESLLWFCNFMSSKSKNSLILESSIYESQTKGLKAFLKKIFINRINKVYASGHSQILLLEALNFKGEIKKTKGVGIFNIKDQPKFDKRDHVLNFLYVGRLSKEKNLDELIKVFSKLPNLILNIIGFGPEEYYLKSIASENVNFLGAIDNTEIHIYYKRFDVLVLPSLSEVWGLVVEEALNNGMPVLASNRVGCVDEILLNNYNGLVFNIDDFQDLNDKIIEISNIDVYNSYRKNISKMNFNKIALDQVKIYTS